MIRALFFDIGNVLVRCSYSRAFEALAARCPHAPAQIESLIEKSGLYPVFESGHLTAGEFHSAVVSLLSLDMAFDEFRAVWCSIFETDPIVDPGWLKDLCRRYPVIAVSDNNTVHWPHVRSVFPFLDDFREFVLSFEIGCTKPNESVFAAALSLVPYPAGDCVFIDDKAANVEAAQRAGMKAIHFQTEAQLRAELSPLLG
jgi:FMN phosphatase YigB (HAD superfamily)